MCATWFRLKVLIALVVKAGELSVASPGRLECLCLCYLIGYRFTKEIGWDRLRRSKIDLPEDPRSRIGLLTALSGNTLPSRTERKGITSRALIEGSIYCLSYTAVLLTFLPCASVPVVLTVRVLPSAETDMRPLTVSLPSFLTVSANVRSLMTL